MINVLPPVPVPRSAQRALHCQVTVRERIYIVMERSGAPPEHGYHILSSRAIETAALMLGKDKSRGYCLEMICADFLAGGEPRK